jgi:hypothetical protein
MSAAAEASARSRIVGLDAMRVLLMLGGLPLHAFCRHAPQPLFTAIALISHLFRLGCFVAISGFLSACRCATIPAAPG